MLDRETVVDFLASHHPFDALSSEEREQILTTGVLVDMAVGEDLFLLGEEVDRFSIVMQGAVDLLSAEGQTFVHYQTGEGIGARAILRGGKAVGTARVVESVRLLVVPKTTFVSLKDGNGLVAAFYRRHLQAAARAAPPSDDPAAAMVSTMVSDAMTPNPLSVPPTAEVREAAAIMREKKISCVLVVQDGALVGMLTTGDLTGRVLAEGRDGSTPVGEIMTPNPASIGPDVAVFEALLLMTTRSFGHVPVVEDGTPVGIITRTNLIRRQTISAVSMIAEIGKRRDLDGFKEIVSGIPGLLSQLVGSGVEAYRVGQLITAVVDALTRRLLVLAEAQFGPPPVPYLWLACGSQGRREQTGQSDQDNCLILHDDFVAAEHDAYFKALAAFVCDGLDACGYVYCPGDMMATADRWRQPVSMWRRYFQSWIDKPDPMAQMLASVMFDLRPIAGDESLFDGLQSSTLEATSKNSIFRAHMIANSLKHQPPLSLFRGFALIRSGEHKNQLDLKHNGVVPIVDLGRAYALQGALTAVNTRERLEDAKDAGVLSRSGGDDLIDAYDLIARVRLENQARQIREGDRPDNFLAPSRLSALERNHLKDAFGVIKQLQSNLGQRSA